MKQFIIKEIEIILNRAKDYYENNKEVLSEKAKNEYRELSEEEKNIKGKYGRNRYHNMSEEKIQSLKECQKIVSLIKVKSLDLVIYILTKQ